MAEELKIMQKVFDMMQYGYGALAQYPKSEKFALCTDIKRCMDTMLERTIEAQKILQKDYLAGSGCGSGKAAGLSAVEP